jgi:hypothetical protein
MRSSGVFLNIQPSQKSLPFKAELDHSRGLVLLELPRFAMLEIKSGLFWKKILDRRSWLRLGVCSQDGFTLSIPCENAIRVAFHGHRWHLSVNRPSHKRPEFDKSGLRSLIFSVFGHAVVICGLLSLVYATQIWQWLQMGTYSEAPASTSMAGRQQPPAHVPFRGMTWTAYSKRLMAPDEKLKSLVSGFNLASGNRTAAAADTGLAADGSAFRVNSAPMQPSLTGQVGELETKARDRAEAGIQLTVDQEAVVRRKFQSFGPEFDRALASALKIDPKLSVSMSYEVEVQPNGFLVLKRMKQQGRIADRAVGDLRQKISETIGAAYVGKGLAGTLVRGDMFFTAK